MSETRSITAPILLNIYCIYITPIYKIIQYTPIFVNDAIYVSTITGRIFALNLSEKKIKWHLYVGSPIVSSPLIYDGILVAATHDSWIKDTSFTGKNFLGIDSNYGTQIWNYEVPGGVFSSPCLVGDDMTWIGLA